MASRTEQRRFGSFVLTHAVNGIQCERWNARLLHRATFDRRLKGDGSFVTADRAEGQEVEVRGVVTGTDTGEVQTRIDGLISALASGDDYLSFYSDRRLLCRLSGDVIYDYLPGSSGIVYRWNATMRSRSPTWESPTLATASFTPTGAGPHTLSLSLNAASAPTYPKLVITNNGSAFSDKQITLTHNGTLVQIQFAGLGMANGETVVIDTREAQLGDGLTTPKTPYTIEGGWFYLLPAAATDLEFAHNVGSGASWDVQVTYNEQFWSM